MISIRLTKIIKYDSNFSTGTLSVTLRATDPPKNKINKFPQEVIFLRKDSDSCNVIKGVKFWMIIKIETTEQINWL